MPTAENYIIARIIAVIDAYDAMTQNRPYRDGMTGEDAALELVRHMGTQFDPEVTRVFIERVLEMQLSVLEQAARA